MLHTSHSAKSILFNQKNYLYLLVVIPLVSYIPEGVMQTIIKKAKYIDRASYGCQLEPQSARCTQQTAGRGQKKGKTAKESPDPTQV